MRLIRPSPNFVRETIYTDKQDIDFVAAAIKSRHPDGKTQVRYDDAGFLWSWNFMIP